MQLLAAQLAVAVAVQALGREGAVELVEDPFLPETDDAPLRSVQNLRLHRHPDMRMRPGLLRRRQERQGKTEQGRSPETGSHGPLQLLLAGAMHPVAPESNRNAAQLGT